MAPGEVRSQTLIDTDNSGGLNWNSGANWTPASVPNAVDVAATINRLSGSGNRTINAADGPFTLGSLNWTIDPNQNDSLRNGQLLFQSASGTSTFTFSGNSGGNLQIRNGASIAVNAGQTLMLNNASSDAGSRLNFTTDGAGGTIAGAGTIVYNDTSGLDGNLLRAIRFQQANAGFSGTFRLASGTLEIHTGGALFGTGTLELSGGRVVTSGNQNVSNDVLISGDFVFDGSDRLQLSGTTTLAPGLHRIDVQNVADRLQFQGDITGPGGFVKDGPGELRFTQNAKTYTGATVINDGRLDISEPGQMVNTSSVMINGGELYLASAGARNYALGPGAIVLNGGLLRQQADGAAADVATLANDILVLGNSRIDARGDTTLVLNGTLSGSGNLQKGAGGSVALTRANPFSGQVSITNGELRLDHRDALGQAGGITVVTGGTLQLNVKGEVDWRIGKGEIVLDGGRLRQSSGTSDDIAMIGQDVRLTANGGTLGTQGDSRMYVRGDIVGPGDLTKSGGGELRFVGQDKNYAGETHVTNGRLRIDDDGIPTATTAINLGGVGNDGNLRFGQRRQRTFSLGQGGNAPIRFVNDGGSIEYTDEEGAVLTNPVQVQTQGNLRSREAGSVFVFTGPISGPGNLDINRGTGGNPVQGGTIYLQGDASGLAGNVDVRQSTLRLGDRTTLGANDFRLRSGSTLALDLNSPTAFGRVASTTATLEAGTVIAPFFTGGLPQGRYIFEIISGTVDDQGAVARDTLLVDYSLRQGSLLLVADVDYRGLNLPLNRIQRSVGSYLGVATGGDSLSAVRAFAANLTEIEELRSFYDSVAAEEVGGMMETALSHGRDQLRVIARNAPHLRGRTTLLDPIGAAPDAATEWTLFNEILVHRASRDRSFELGGYDSSGTGFIVGADRMIDRDRAVGLFASYEHGRTSFDMGRGWADADTLGIGGMASWFLPRGQITAAAQYLHHSFQMERYSPLGTARSRNQGDQLGLLLQGSTEIRRGALSVAPSAGLQYQHLWVGSFDESGGPIAQSFASHRADSLELALGARVGYELPGRRASYRPEFFAEYRRELLDNDITIRSDLIGSSGGLSITAPGRDRGYVALGGGIQAAFSNTASAYIQYEAQLYDSDTVAHGIYTGFRWYFGEDNLSQSVLRFTDSPATYRESLRGSVVGDVIDAINLRALVMAQYDQLQTRSRGGAEADPDDPADVDQWYARRVRLSAERELIGGFHVDTAFQFGEDLDSSQSGTELFRANVGWDLFEPFTLSFGLDKVPLSWEESTASHRLKTIERSVASRTFTRLGGDDIGGSHWRAAAAGRFREIYENPVGPIKRYDFHYEFAVANPREDVYAPWRDNEVPGMGRWPSPSYYLRLQNELRTGIGQFDFGVDLARISTFRARSDNEITGADALSPFLSYTLGGFNFTAVGMMARYDRDEENGGARREPTGLTLIPSYFITPSVELVGMYSRFDADGDFAIRHNQAARNFPTSYPENRRFNEIDQFYFGVNHYIRGDDLKLMYGVEHIRSDGARADRPVGEEDSWGFRIRLQMRL